MISISAGATATTSTPLLADTISPMGDSADVRFSYARADRRAGVDVVLRAQQHFGFPSRQTYPPPVLEKFVAQRQADAFMCCVAFAQTRAVGHCLLAAPRVDELADYDWAERFGDQITDVLAVGALAVDPLWAKRGISGLMVDDLVRRAPKHAIVIAAVWKLNTAALRLFSRRGVVVAEISNERHDEFVFRLERQDPTADVL